ncbi:MAG: Ig-like domain-containing protein, partial [Chloroflexota bacterium]
MLSVRRDWGFGGGSQIQGLFTMEATGPGNLVSVTFKIDSTVVGEVTSSPFKIRFDTDDYLTGWHTLTAVGKTIDG